jgi:hypothetical protein
MSIQINQCPSSILTVNFVPLLKVAKEERPIHRTFDCIMPKHIIDIRPAHTCKFRVRKNATFSNPSRDASVDGIKA